MTSRDFSYWLQGFFEITNPKTIDPVQTEQIKKHLSLVFKHEIDPSMGDNKHQQELNEIHNSPSPYEDLFTKPNKMFPDNEQEAIEMFGAKPSPVHLYNIHGWYHPDEGQPRC
jgi:hypothetical protein